MKSRNGAEKPARAVTKVMPISELPVTGTYTQNADCTGTAQITPKGSATTNFNTVAVNGGKQLLLIETDNNTLITGTAQE